MAPEHVRGGNAGPASQKRIENQIAGIGERLHEELDQRSRERGGVTALAAFRFDLDHVARPRDPAVPAFNVVGVPVCGLPGVMVLAQVSGRPARPRAQQPTT